MDEDGGSTTKFEEITKHIGDFGFYQKRLYSIVIIPAGLGALSTMGAIFLLAIPSHRCQIPGLANDSYMLQGYWHENLINHSIPTKHESGGYSQCKLFLNANDNDDYANLSSETVDCTSWVYDKSVFTETVSSEFNLVCSDVILQSHASMVYMLGTVIGSLLIGIIGDWLGRKPALCISITVMFAANTGLIWAPNLLTFLILRFFVAIANIGCWISALILGLELVGPSKRVLAGMIIELVWCVSEYLLAALSFWLRDWRNLQISFAVLFGIFLIYWVVIPESPRWLLAVGREEKARELFHKIAEVNKRNIPKNMILFDTQTRTSFSALLDLAKSSVLLLRLLMVCYIWFVCSAGYYGLTFNTGRIGGDIYINFVISVCMELASYFFAIFLVDRLGRRPVISCSLILGGVSCLCTIPVELSESTNLDWVILTLSMVGKFGISAALAVMFIFTPELFPTPLRSATLGVVNLIGRIGSVISPYIADLGIILESDFGKSLPFVVFGCFMLSAGGMTYLIPETFNCPLPESIDDAIALERTIHSEAPGSKRESYFPFVMTIILHMKFSRRSMLRETVSDRTAHAENKNKEETVPLN